MRAAKIGALAADGHKWMFGPEGCAIFYISPELQEQVDPVEFGWTNTASYERLRQPRHDAAARRRAAMNAERSTPSAVTGCARRSSSCLEVGMERIGPKVQALGDRIAEGVRAARLRSSGRRGRLKMAPAS